MTNPIGKFVIRILRVPPEPPAPFGDEQSLMVFRAGPRYFQYIFVKWVIGQVFAGFILLSAILGGGIATILTANENMAAGVLAGFVVLLLLALLVTQLVLSLAMLRLDYELRWYKVTDRSLRLREGIWIVREMTLTFANIQNMTITQGPIQRLLGIADLQVQTAGGGGAGAGQQQQQVMFPMHVGVLRGVDNAAQIREIMLSRMKLLKDSGLGDHDDQPLSGAHAPAFVTVAGKGAQATTRSSAVLKAASELLNEATAFRQAAHRFETGRAKAG